jgi:hypothetical protein
MNSEDREGPHQRAKVQLRAKRKLTPATRKALGWCCLALGVGGFLLTTYLLMGQPGGFAPTRARWLFGHLTFALALLSAVTLRGLYKEAPMPGWGKVGFRFGLAELLLSVLSAGVWMGVGQVLSDDAESILLGLYLALAGAMLFLFGLQVAEWRGLSGRTRYLHGVGFFPLVWGGLGCGAIVTLIVSSVFEEGVGPAVQRVLDLFFRFSHIEPHYAVLQVAPVWLLLGLGLCILPHSASRAAV